MSERVVNQVGADEPGSAGNDECAIGSAFCV